MILVVVLSSVFDALEALCDSSSLAFFVCFSVSVPWRMVRQP